MSKNLAIFALAALIVAPAAHAGKKNKKDAGPPPEGWHQEEGWTGSCWYPPNFTEMGSGTKRISWQDTRNAIMGQWSGDREDGVVFKDKVVLNVETVLLAKPERIELVSKENLEQCIAHMSKGGGSSWSDWLTEIPGRLTVGECPNAPLDYTLFDYLNISREWQIPTGVCKDDVFKIKASPQDYYRIEEGGPWINASGDIEQAATGKLPCNIEGCFKGQLVMRFTGESGVSTVHAVGTYFEFRAPEHGAIVVMINDDSWNDNVFKVESGLEHHTSIEYSPVNK